LNLAGKEPLADSLELFEEQLVSKSKGIKKYGTSFFNSICKTVSLVRPLSTIGLLSIIKVRGTIRE